MPVAKKKRKRKKAKAKGKAKMGRPTKRTQALVDSLCEWVSDGNTIRTWCRANKIASSTLYSWTVGDEPLSERLACARRIGEAMLEDEIMEIADNQLGEVDRDRLRIYAREKRLVWSNPRRYSEKTQVEQTIEVKVSLTDVERQIRLKKLLGRPGKTIKVEIDDANE